MNWTERWASPPATRTSGSLRKFGFIMAVAFGLIGGLLLWRGRDWATWLLRIAAAFALLATVVPRALAPVERGWLWVGERIGGVVTIVLLTVVFFVVITPIGVLKRLVSGDTMGLRLDPKATTYWVPVEPDGPATRPDRPF